MDTARKSKNATGEAATSPAARRSQPGAARTKGAQSARKVLQMLTYFEPDRPLATVDALARACRLPLSTAYRYVALLREVGLLSDDGRGSYQLSVRVVRMAKAAQAAMGLLEPARPVMQRLNDQTGETVLLLRRIGDHAICIERIESEQMVRLSFEIGTALPLHAGAGPKLLLAMLNERERQGYLTRVARDAGARLRAGELRAELARIREQGWAHSEGELTPGVWAAAAVVREAGRPVAALSLAAPTFRVAEADRARLTQLTREAADEVSAALDAPRP